MDEYTIEVPSMTCGGCEIVITGAVEDIPGVGLVEADAGSGCVTIHGDASVEPRVRAAIETAGYGVPE